MVMYPARHIRNKNEKEKREIQTVHGPGDATYASVRRAAYSKLINKPGRKVA